MRIISGKYKGKKLKGFNIEGTRPTMDRIKESLFNIIKNKLDKAICLDLFAGSGSLGIEALSNGAKKCYFIDHNEIAIKTIKENLDNIKEEYQIIKTDYKNFLEKTTQTFDIIFLDPPYQTNLINKAIKIIEEKELLNKNGILICEYQEIKPISNYQIIKEKNYKDKNIKIYQK